MLRQLLDVRPEERLLLSAAVFALTAFGPAMLLRSHDAARANDPGAIEVFRALDILAKEGAPPARHRALEHDMVGPHRHLRGQRGDGHRFSGVGLPRRAQPDRDDIRTRPRAARLFHRLAADRFSDGRELVETVWGWRGFCRDIRWAAVGKVNCTTFGAFGTATSIDRRVADS